MRKQGRLGTLMVAAALCGCGILKSNSPNVGDERQAEEVLPQTPAHPCSFHFGIKPADGHSELYDECTGNFTVPLFAGIDLFYNSMDSNALGPAGWGVRLGIRDQLTIGSNGVVRTLPTGEQYVYSSDGSGGFASPPETDTALSQPSSDRYSVRVPGGTTLTFTNPNGTAWVLSSAQDRNGNTTTIGRDSLNEETSIADSFGNATTLSWSGGLLRSVTNAEGLVWSLAYDGASNLVAIHDPAAGGASPTTTLTYGSAHLLTKMLSPTGALLGDWDYFADGSLAGMTDSGGRHTAITSCANAVSITNAFRETTTFKYANQTLVQIIEPDGLSHAQFAYDSLHRLTSRTDWLGKSEHFTYGSNNDVISYTDRFGMLTTMTWDGHHNALTTTDATNKTATFTYDSHDLPLTMRDAAGRVTTFNRDANGNLLNLVGSDGTVLASATYGAHGELLSSTDEVGRTASLAYDSHLNLATLVSPEGLRSSFGYSPLGRLLSTVDSLGESTTFAYDGADRQVGETMPNGGSVSSTLDLDSRPVAMVNYVGPNALTWSSSYAADGSEASTTRNGIADLVAPEQYSTPAAPEDQGLVCQ